MKGYIFFLISMVLCTDPTSAQQSSKAHALALSYDDVSVGRNINLVYQRTLSDKWTVYGGLKYHLNSPNFKNDYTVYTPYFKEFEAQGIGQRIGAKAGLEYKLWQTRQQCIFFAFWDLQYTRANIFTKIIGFGIDPYFVSYEADKSVTYTAENTFGIGAKFPAGRDLTFSIRAGLGLNYVASTDPLFKGIYFPLSGNRRLPMPASRIISAGFAYQLGKHVKRIKKPSEVADRFLQLAYNNVQVGRNYSLSYHQHIAPHTLLYGGIKMHLNSKAFVDYNRMEDSYYFKQFRAENPGQSLGIRAGAEQHFSLKGLGLFIFYDIQLTRATVRNFTFINEFQSGYSRASIISLHKYEKYQNDVIYYRISKPVTAFENTVGLGARFPITDNIKFRIQGGIGYNFYARPDNYESYTIRYPTTAGTQVIEYKNVKFDAPRSEFSKMFSIGIEYGL